MAGAPPPAAHARPLHNACLGPCDGLYRDPPPRHGLPDARVVSANDARTPAYTLSVRSFIQLSVRLFCLDLMNWRSARGRGRVFLISLERARDERETKLSFISFLTNACYSAPSLLSPHHHHPYILRRTITAKRPRSGYHIFPRRRGVEQQQSCASGVRRATWDLMHST